jgi:uridine kinase
MDKNSDINRYILQKCIKRNLVNKKKEYAPEINFVFAVSGAAALGKTAFCKNLERYLNDLWINTVHIPLDGFLLDRKTRRHRKLSGYNPESTDMPFLIETMKKLIYDGREINLPLYDHNTGSWME